MNNTQRILIARLRSHDICEDLARHLINTINAWEEDEKAELQDELFPHIIQSADKEI